MNSHVQALFEFTRSRVSEQHIVDFSPGDPGYQSYVSAWSEILRSGEIPKKNKFALSEVIALTGWTNADGLDDPQRFREYRRFTSAVAIALYHYGYGSDGFRAPNYVARDLIIDCSPLEPEHLKLVRNVLPITRDVLAATNSEEEYPFFTFGALILAQMAKDYDDAARHAAQLIADEQAVRNNESLNCGIEDARFLLGLTNYDQLHGQWKTFASKLINPTGDASVQQIQNALAETT